MNKIFQSLLLSDGDTTSISCIPVSVEMMWKKVGEIECATEFFIFVVSRFVVTAEIFVNA